MTNKAYSESEIVAWFESDVEKKLKLLQSEIEEKIQQFEVENQVFVNITLANPEQLRQRKHLVLDMIFAYNHGYDLGVQRLGLNQDV